MSMQELIQFARDREYPSTNFILDGKIHRFGQKNKCWYVGHQFHLTNGNPCIVAVIGDWRLGKENWDTFTTNTKMSSEDKILEKRYREKIIKTYEIGEKEKNLKAAIEAKKRWDALNFDDTYLTEYHKKKGIFGSFGVKVDMSLDGDKIVIPLYNVHGDITSLQTIKDNGEKRFLPGGKKGGSFHTIGVLDHSTPEAWLVEGFATGATVHMATKEPVIVTFDSNNLPEVTKKLVVEYPDCKFKIASDDDWKTIVRGEPYNAGKIKAKEAAAFTRTEPYFPIFKDRDDKDTDFNDLHKKEGLQSVVSQLTDVVVEKNLYECLGFEENYHYFYREDARVIIKIKNFSEVELLSLAELDYWENYFPGKTSPNWLEARNYIIQKSTAKGKYNPYFNRGCGVWKDQDRFVLNTGSNLILNGNVINRGNLKSRYIYVQTLNKLDEDLKKPLNTEETRILEEIASTFKWVNPQSQFLILGWLAVSRIAGALPVRPLIWINGQKGSGKTTIMERFVRPLLGEEMGHLNITGGTTEAGIRQTLGNDSVPLIFDEFENEGKSTEKRNESILQLFRQTWSSSNAKIVKGTATGGTNQYKLNFCALVSSISNSLKTAADKSRFSILELKSNKDTNEDWERLDKKLRLLDEDFGQRLFSRSISQAENILTSYNIIKGMIADKVTQRFGQQTGILLAGYYSLVSDYPLTDETARGLVSEFDFKHEHDEEEYNSDENELLVLLLTTKIPIQHSDLRTRTDTVGKFILDEDWNYFLRQIGIRVEDDYFWIANQHTELSKIFKGTKFDGKWSDYLKRVESRKLERKFFGNGQNRSVGLPKELAKKVCDY